MHIPDGFLSPPVWLGFGAISVAGLAAVGRAARRTMEDHHVPLMGVTGAFVFASQMVNLPVGVGTSGHLVGSALLAALLGPHMAALVMAAVVLVQCLLFQDGGLTAMGANMFVMGLLGPYLAWGIMAPTWRLGARWRMAGIFMGAWLSVLAGAVVAALALAASGTVPLVPVLVAMSGVHAVIGLGEAFLTVGLLSFLWTMRPSLAPQEVR